MTTKVQQVEGRPEFLRVPKQHGDHACAYEVKVDGVLIGHLSASWVRGVRAPRGCVGGCRGGFEWFFDRVDGLEEAVFFPGNWRSLAEAKRHIHRQLTCSAEQLCDADRRENNAVRSYVARLSIRTDADVIDRLNRAVAALRPPPPPCGLCGGVNGHAANCQRAVDEAARSDT
jgi:hypothetical protein